MHGMKQIIVKELTRVFSDKKLVFSLFVLPAVLMIGLYYFIGQMQTAMQNDIKDHKSVVYIQNEPEGLRGLVDMINLEADVHYTSSNEDLVSIKDGILNGTIDLLVAFDKNFLNQIKDYKSNNQIPDIKTYYNPSEEYSSTARNTFINQVLSVYQQQLLTERFGEISQLTAFTIDIQPEKSIIIDNQKATGKLFGTLLPYLITFMLFTGAMSLGVDAITGEKERGTMASMLLTPLKRQEIVFGKLFALTILSSLSAAVYAIAMIVSMPVILKNLSGGGIDGLKLNFTPLQMIELFAIMLSLVFLYVALVSVVSVLAKTAKEASAYVTPIYIIVIVAGMITMFTGNEVRELPMYAIPVYGSAISIQDLLTGELTFVKFLASIGGTIGISLIVTAFIVKAFNSEKVMFNA